MGLIRKPKSKRVRIKDMERWRRKAKENKRKARRDAKRNPQWKSRVKKDPGVPNSFPFKDLILAEAEQARALKLEEKNKAKQLTASDIAQMSGLSVVESSRISTAAVVGDLLSDDEDEAPELLDPDLPDLDSAINKADLVIQVLDCRDPLAYRVPSFEKVLANRGKKLFFVLNKTELVPRESVSTWLSHLRLEYPTFPFKPSTAFLTSVFIPVTPKGKERAPIDDELGAAALRECITTLAKEKKVSTGDSTPFTVALVGMTNTGKSAVINSILHEENQKVYRIRVGDDPSSQTTIHPCRVASDELSTEDGLEITLIDTPGFTFKLPTDVTDETLAELRIKENLLQRRGLFEKMKHPFNTASWVLTRTNPEDIQVLYNTQAFENNLESMVKSLGRACGRLSKSGKTDKDSTASMILRDWRQGKLGIYTVPPKSSLSTILNATTPASSPFKDLYERTDSLVLDKLPTKAEMIAGTHGPSVVRFKVGEPWPENVSVDLHARYDVGGEDQGLTNGFKMKKRIAHGDDMDVDDEDEDDEEEDEDEDDEMDDGEDQSDEEEEWAGFGSGSGSASTSDGAEDSDNDLNTTPPPKAKSKRRASPDAPLEPVPLKASKSKKVAFAPSKPATAPTPRLTSAKDAKPSKTALKKASQEAAKERSRAAVTKSVGSKPPVKPKAPAEPLLKATNEPSAARKKALATAAASGAPSEQPYDFSAHFK
ncbi:hypothetical protein FRB90_005376 [Tulasnella sp. 427]|nr:hypothetical protein FRB90_005376 [Tulasnella sp. 427]